jgi:GAF domain-containing protein
METPTERVDRCGAGCAAAAGDAGRRLASPEAVFTAVSAKVGWPLGVDLTVIAQCDQGSAATVVGAWSSTGADVPSPRPGRAWAATTCPPWCFRPTAARIDDYAAATGAISDIARDWGHRAAVGAPINVEGRLWGVMIAGSLLEPLPTDAEARLGVFTELVAAAISHAQAWVERGCCPAATPAAAPRPGP